MTQISDPNWTTSLEDLTALELNNRAAESLAMLERKAAAGDMVAAGMYRQMIDMAVVQWANGLPEGGTPAEKASFVSSGMDERSEAAMLWARQISASLPDGGKAFMESTKAEEFPRYRDNWIECLWRWLDDQIRVDLKKKLATQTVLPSFAVHFYLLRRAWFLAVSRDHSQFFNARFIRQNLRLIVLAESLGDDAVLNELDRPRRVNQALVSHKMERATMPKFVLLYLWLAGCVWQVPPSERAGRLSELVSAITGEKIRYTTDQIHGARKALGLLAESRFGK